MLETSPYEDYITYLNRLHREALKQSATDPMSGKIDVSILTTGLSSAARKRRVEVAQSLKKLIQAKGKVATLNFQKIFQELKESSDLVRELYPFSKLYLVREWPLLIIPSVILLYIYMYSFLSFCLPVNSMHC